MPKTEDKYSDTRLDPSEDAFNDLVNTPDMQALNDQGDAIASEDEAAKLRKAEKDDAASNDQSQEPENQYYNQSKDTQKAQSNPQQRRNNFIKIGAGGGILGGILIALIMLLPLKIPGIMSMIGKEAGQRVEQVAEHRATMIVARAIAQKFALTGSGVVVENGVFKTLVASMRTNNFEKKLAAKGLTIVKDGDGVRLKLKDGTNLGGGVLKNEVEIKKALESNQISNKIIKDIVKEEIPTWRWVKRAKFAKWLRHKYGIPRYGITNSQESDTDKAIEEMERERLKAEVSANSESNGKLMGCITSPDSPCELVDEANTNNTGTKSSNSGDVTGSLDEANEQAIEAAAQGSTQDASNLVTEEITKKFASKAIPIIGWIDLAATISHLINAEAKDDYIGKAIAGLKERNYAQLNGFWSGYSSQIQLGAMRPDFIGKLAEQTEGIEKAQAFNYINGNTISGQPITLFENKAYATTASDIPGLPVDRINSNEPGYIKEKLDSFNSATSGVAGAASKPTSVLLELWYQTLGEGGLLGEVGDIIGDIANSLTPDVVKDWAGRLMEKGWAKLLEIFGLDYNPFVTGAKWFNNAHAGATASYNTYGKEIGMRKLSASQASVQNMSIAVERNQYKQDKGVLYALFSPEEDRSLTNQIAITAPSNASQLGMSMGSFITNAPSQLLASFFPTTKAANPYVDLYGIDPYGATTKDLNAPLSKEFLNGEGCPEVPEGTFDTCSVDTVVAEAMLCNFEPDNQDCSDEEVAASTVSSGGGTNFRIASYNIKTGSSDAWNTASTNNMDKNGFQVVGLQEAEIWPTYNSIATKAKALGYGIFPDLSDPAQATRNGAQARAIAYKLDKFRLVKTDVVTFNRMDDPQQPASAPIVWLEDTTTGQQVIVMNTHNPAYGYGGGPNSSYNGPMQRRDAAVSYIEKIKQLQAEGLPIFFTGDFNEGWGVRTSLNTTLDNDYKNLFYCMLKNENNLLVHALDVANNKEAVCNATRSSGPIDHIYVSKEVEVTKYAELTGTNNYLGTDHDIVPYADVVVPGDPSAASGANIRVATFNVLHSPDRDWRSRLTKSVNALTSKQISIAGLQEMRPDQQKLFKQGNYGGGVYDMYPAQVTDGQAANENPDSVVIWDKKKFALVSGKQKSIKYEGGARKVNIVKLRYIEGGATGPELYVLNTHDPIDARSQSGNGPQDRRDNNELYYQTIKNELTDAPVVLTGDFNSKMTVASSANKPLGNLRENLAYCILTRNNLLVHTSDSQQNKTGCPSQSDVLGRNDVDHIFISPSLKASGYSVVKRGANGGDHEMVYSNIAVPGIGGEASGAAGEWSWPVDKKWWTTNRADFLGSHPTYSGTFTSPYTLGVAADIGDPPDGSPIYAMLGGKVTKTSLCGNGEGMVIESDTAYGKLSIAYAHGPNPRFKVGDSVSSGDRILDIGDVGCKVDGGHVHIDMALLGKHICPQDVFLAMGSGKSPDLNALVPKGKSPCGRL